jgi:CBS domain containing-hemolysin-like protein
MTLLWAFVALAAIVLSGIFSGMETGLYSLERVRLQVRASGGDAVAKRLLHLLHDLTNAVCTLLIANNVVNLLLTTASSQVLLLLFSSALADGGLEFWNTVIVVPLLFVCGELLPKSLFLGYPTALTRALLPVYRVAEWILRPLVRPLLILTRRLAGGSVPARTVLERSSILESLTTGDEAETLSHPQRMMVGRLTSLREVTAQERMIPLERVSLVRASAKEEEVLRIAAAAGRSRLMVASDDGRRLVGYITVLDIVRGAGGGRRRSEVIHSLPSVAPTDTLLHVLRQLRKERRPLARVETPAGTLGIIATADVVDMLFGDREGPAGE